MAYAEIHPRLKSFVSTVSDIQKVYGAEVGVFEGFPCAVVKPGKNTDKTLDNCSNERVYSFDVNLYNEYELDSNEEETENDMMILSDKVIEVLDSCNLSDVGVVFTPQVTVGGFAYLENEGGWMRTFSMTIEVRKQINI